MCGVWCSVGVGVWVCGCVVWCVVCFALLCFATRLSRWAPSIPPTPVRSGLPPSPPRPPPRRGPALARPWAESAPHPLSLPGTPKKFQVQEGGEAVGGEGCEAEVVALRRGDKSDLRGGNPRPPHPRPRGAASRRPPEPQRVARRSGAACPGPTVPPRSPPPTRLRAPTPMRGSAEGALPTPPKPLAQGLAVGESTPCNEQ